MIVCLFVVVFFGTCDPPASTCQVLKLHFNWAGGNFLFCLLFVFNLLSFYIHEERVLPTYMSVYHMCCWCLQRPEENSDCLEPELQAVVSHMWILGIEARSPRRMANANC